MLNLNAELPDDVREVRRNGISMVCVGFYTFYIFAYLSSSVWMKKVNKELDLVPMLCGRNTFCPVFANLDSYLRSRDLHQSCDIALKQGFGTIQ